MDRFAERSGSCNRLVVSRVLNWFDHRVISRNFATVLEKAARDTQTIGAESGVAFVLKGSVRKVGDALRVTAQLIHAETDEHLRFHDLGLRS